jgi:putative ABC transport system permease protein
MGIPLLRGRLFTERDNGDAPNVALINEAMAKRFFPDQDPIGQRIHVTNGPETFREIVGIVGDVKQYGLNRETPVQTYTPFLQQPFFNSMSMVMRTAGDPVGLGPAIRREVLNLDKDQPVASTRALEEIVSNSVANQRFSMVLLGVFAGVALILAAVGIYGVMAYAVTQRTHELGIRLALGAQTGNVLRLVIRQGMILAFTGMAMGLAASLALTRVISTLLFGVSATDPLTFVAISLLLGAVAFLACYLPARRATKVDPMIALRYE